MRRSTRWAMVVVVLLCAGIGVGAEPASAHSSRSVVRLAVSGHNGTTTVRAYLVYQNDRQPVTDEIVLAVLSGTGSVARSFQLRPDSRGPGYFASPVHLAAGHWKLRVSAVAATTGFATGELTVGVAGQLRQVRLRSSFDADVASRRADARSSPVRHGVLWGAGAFFLLLLAALAVKMQATGLAADGPARRSSAEEPGALLR